MNFKLTKYLLVKNEWAFLECYFCKCKKIHSNSKFKKILILFWIIWYKSNMKAMRKKIMEQKDKHLLWLHSNLNF